MPSPGAGSGAPHPYAVVETGRSTLTFFHGDCLDVFKTLPAGLASVLVTSPPYNLGVRYRSYDDTLPRPEYLQWTDAWIAAAAAVLAPDGSLFLNLGAKPTDPWTAMDIAQTARAHLQLQNTIHWIKSLAIERAAAGVGANLPRDLAVGHYKPINSPRFINDCHEFVFHFSPAGRTVLDRRAIGVEYQDASNIARWQTGGSNRRCRGNTWFIPYDTIQSRDKERPHPATFPPRLAEYCLRLHGLDRITLAVDPFLGLGSSAIAAAELGLDFIGIEIDAHYLDEAVDLVHRAASGVRTRGSQTGRRRRQEKEKPCTPAEPGLFD
jgi:site-specific DNA-methyltransferase (adenine-specific)